MVFRIPNLTFKRLDENRFYGLQSALHGVTKLMSSSSSSPSSASRGVSNYSGIAGGAVLRSLFARGEKARRQIHAQRTMNEPEYGLRRVVKDITVIVLNVASETLTSPRASHLQPADLGGVRLETP